MALVPLECCLVHCHWVLNEGGHSKGKPRVPSTSVGQGSGDLETCILSLSLPRAETLGNANRYMVLCLNLQRVILLTIVHIVGDCLTEGLYKESTFSF